MKNYYRVMLGRGSKYAVEAVAGGFIGTDFGLNQDLSADLPEDWRAFNQKFRPVLIAAQPGKTKISAGLACGAIWTVSCGIAQGDIVLCPNGSGTYHVGEVVGDYVYAAGSVLPHRRAVKWLNATIARSSMSDALRNSSGSLGTVSSLTPYAAEIEQLLATPTHPCLIAAEPTAEEVSAFALEKHLEDFLVKNWAQTELGREYDIYTEDGESVGQQYLTDTGPLDLLAIKKDKSELLVVELKKGRASDAVVGQVLRYMGFVKEDLAESGQTVRGVIIALESDVRLRRALAVVPNVQFYRYQIDFKLLPASS